MTKTYFDICKKVMKNLFYETPATFAELDETVEGQRVKQLVNEVNNFVCLNENRPWKFREVKQPIVMVEGIKYYDLPNGFTKWMRYQETLVRLVYNQHHKLTPNAKGQPILYWIENNKYRLFPVPDASWNNKILDVYYLTNNFAYDKCLVPKAEMTEENDTSIIPEPFLDILVYGACRDFRASANDAKSAFYDNKYKLMYKAMKSACRLSEDYPDGFDIFGATDDNIDRQIKRDFYNPYTVNGREE